MATLEVSINYAPARPGVPESVLGIVRHGDGRETPFGGWLSLLGVLQTAAATASESDERTESD